MPKGYTPKQLSCRQVMFKDQKHRAYELAVDRKYDRLLKDAMAVCGLSKEDKLKHHHFVETHARTYKYALVVPPRESTTTASRVPRSPVSHATHIMPALPVAPTDELMPAVDAVDVKL